MRSLLRVSLALLAFAAIASAQSAPVNPASTDYSTFVTQGLNDLLRVGAPTMVNWGLNVVNGFGGVVFSLILIRWAYQSYNHHHFQLNLQPIIAFLVLIAWIDTFLYYYVVPIPGVGIAFSDLPAKIAEELTGFLDQGAYQALLSRLHTLTANLQQPFDIFDVMGLFGYLAIYINIIIAESILFMVTAYGYIFYAVASLLGPIFISALMFPVFRGYFHGWLSTWLRFASYQVVAKALIFIWANILVRVLDTWLTGNYELGNAFAMSIPFAVLNVAMWASCFRIPHFVDNLFSGSGSAGHGGLGGLIPNVVARIF